MKWRPYTEYKNSSTGWLGKIPKDWRITRAKFCSKINMGQSPNSEDCNLEGIGKPFLQGNGEFGHYCPIPKQYCEVARKTARKADLLISVRAPVGAINVADQDYGIGRGLCGITANESYIRSSFYWYLLHHIRIQLNLNATGSTYDAVSADDVGNMVFLIPSIVEQNAITAFLARETEHIDTLIAKKERQIELLKEKRAALVSHAVTKGLNPNAKMKDSGIDWLGKIPEHWEAARVKWVARLESGHTPDKKVEEYWRNCTIPWVSLNDTGFLKDHDYIGDTAYCVNEMGLANSSARLLPARAVVFTRDATIGLCAITTKPMAVSQHIIAWLCGPRIIPEYLLHVFYSMTQELEKFTMGSTIKTIGMPDVKELTTPIPPLKDQREIIEWVSKKKNHIDQLIAKVGNSIDRLREYRIALISAAVTGKIDVCQEVT
jgi:type I restriction enzyme, S subunit